MSAKSIHPILQQPNARIWVYVNDGPVKLTLRPGQSLSWGRSRRHEEGWSSEGVRWSWDGQNAKREWETDGTDCDGRLRRAGEDVSAPHNFRSIPSLRGWHDDGTEIRDDSVMFPKWSQESQEQRDYAAEAMGY